jgi:gluconate 2-dehydrogenase alpha chain
MPYYATIFSEATKKLGLHPYPNPAALNSASYTNPDGITRPGCLYCGFCDRFGCMIGAKAQPTNTLLPVVQKQKSVSLRNGCTVRRIVYEKAAGGSGRVTGVNYIDSNGEEVFQPADLVFLGSWTLNNTRLLLLSGIGEPYDPATGKGVVGRNLTHQVSFTAAVAFFEKPLNRFMGAAPAGMRISDFDGDTIDHSNLSFLRGGTFGGIGQGYQPIISFGTLPPSVKARWGSEWKKASVYWYDRAGAIGFAGEHIPYRENYMDLDPTYKDHQGDPLIRLTLDWRENERKMAEFAIAKGVELARAMGAKEVSPGTPYGHYDARRYQSTHVQGGTIMGVSPEHSVVNTFGQHWQAANLFVLGASMFANNGSSNPTPTVLALTYRTADAVVDRYLKRPENLL